MTSIRILPAAALLASALTALGCAAVPRESRIEGVPVPASWIEAAEKGAAGEGDLTQAQACLALSRKLWEPNRLEALRFLRRGSALRDSECCREYLIRSEQPSVNQSQRVYARLFLEGLLRRGPLLSTRGEDIREELYQQLCCAWRLTEPCSGGKATQVLRSLLDLGWRPDRATSAVLAQLVRESGLPVRTGRRATLSSGEPQLCAMEAAEEPRTWLRVPLAKGGRQTDEWVVSEGGAWGGGSDRLFLNSDVLAFLVNSQGEPSFHGTQLSIVNLGDAPVYLTSLSVGRCSWELLPGREEVLPLSMAGLKGEATTGIPVLVRHLRILP